MVGFSVYYSTFSLDADPTCVFAYANVSDPPVTVTGDTVFALRMTGSPGAPVADLFVNGTRVGTESGSDVRRLACDPMGYLNVGPSGKVIHGLAFYRQSLTCEQIAAISSAL